MIHVARTFNAVGSALQRFSYLLLVPLLIALLYDTPNVVVWGPVSMPHTILAFLASFGVATILWVAIEWGTRKAGEEDLGDMEAYLALGVSLVVVALVGALPFLFSGSLPALVDAVFESVAGLSTTAATLLHDQPHRVPPSVLFYRSLLQTAGGLAIVVIAVAFLSRLTQKGLHSLQAKSPHTATTRIQRRVKELTATLGSIYGILILALFLLVLAVLRMDGLAWKQALLEGLVLAMGTISTGGFTMRADGIMAYDLWVLEGILVPFMLIGATGLSLHYHTLQGKPRRLLRDPEWRFLLVVVAAATLVVGALLWRQGTPGLSALEDGLFMVTSLLTTTGFHVDTIHGWPAAAHLVLVLMMFIGGTTGSTAGGLKPIRLLLLLKVLWRELQRLLHPRAVIPVRVSGQVIKEDTLLQVIAFFFALLTLWMFSAFVLVFLEPGLGLLEGAATAIGAISNTGIALHPIGPDRFAGLLDASKWVLILLMAVGRFEILPLLLLLRPASWRS